MLSRYIVGDEEIVGMVEETRKTTVTGVEMFQIIRFCQAGDNIGALLRGVEREDILRGQVLCAPGSITPHKKFEAEVYVLKKERWSSHTILKVTVHSFTFVLQTLLVKLFSRGHRDDHAW